MTLTLSSLIGPHAGWEKVKIVGKISSHPLAGFECTTDREIASPSFGGVSVGIMRNERMNAMIVRRIPPDKTDETENGFSFNGRLRVSSQRI